jgi:hypothetical protein
MDYKAIAEDIKPIMVVLPDWESKVSFFFLESLENWHYPWLFIFDSYDNPLAFNSL